MGRDALIVLAGTVELWLAGGSLLLARTWLALLELVSAGLLYVF